MVRSEKLSHMTENRKIHFIVGPTASGKSQMALKLASENSGVILNADSLQVYNSLPILTSQPTVQDKEIAPHELYGICEFYEQMNAMKWAKIATDTINKVWSNNKQPIIVGGTGMYIKCLTEGISELPEVSKEVRNEAVILAQTNYQKLCEIVYANDESIRNVIKPDNNRQMIRAYEILKQSGLSIKSFFDRPKHHFLTDVEYEFTLLCADRKLLYKRINNRFVQMLHKGAIDEVRKLLQQTQGSKDYPIFQAIGVSEICDYLNGRYNFDEMVQKACMNTRRYAKRQITWFKNQLKGDNIHCVSPG